MLSKEKIAESAGQGKISIAKLSRRVCNYQVIFSTGSSC